MTSRRSHRMPVSAVARALHVRGDHLGPVVAGQRLQVVGEIHDCLIAAADQVAEAEAGPLHHAERGGADAAALGDHADRAGAQAGEFVQRGGEAGDRRRGGVDDADAIRAAQREPGFPAQRHKIALQRRALGAGLREVRVDAMRRGAGWPHVARMRGVAPASAPQVQAGSRARH